MTTLTTKLISAAIGAGVGYFVGCVIADIIWLKENQDDFEYEDLDEDPGNDDETRRPTVNMNREAHGIKSVKNYTEYFKDQGKPQLAALVEKYGRGTTPVPDDTVALSVTEMTDEMYEDANLDVPPEIQIISMEEYANTEGYQAITLKYYEDDVMTDERDIPIPDPEAIVGDDALVSFGELSGDEDVVYVRNHTKKTMYEVIRTNKEYAVPVQRRHKKEEENVEEDNT